MSCKIRNEVIIIKFRLNHKSIQHVFRQIIIFLTLSSSQSNDLQINLENKTYVLYNSKIFLRLYIKPHWQAFLFSDSRFSDMKPL